MNQRTYRKDRKNNESAGVEERPLMRLWRVGGEFVESVGGRRLRS
jgi:hypothetical protein